MHDFVRAVLELKGREIQTVSPEASVTEAVRLMDEKRIGAVLVMQDRRPAGIFTERDVLRRVVAAGRNPEKTPIAEVMTREVIAIRSSATVEDAMAVMSEKRCRHLPVLDGDAIAGLISSGDLLHWQIRDKDSHIEQLVNFITGKYPA